MTVQEFNMKDVEKKVRLIRETAEQLKQMADNFPAVERNVSRILASVKMLELNMIEL